MFFLTRKSYDVTIVETRTYTIRAYGNDQFTAEQEAIAEFKRQRISGNLQADKISSPKAVKIRQTR